MKKYFATGLAALMAAAALATPACKKQPDPNDVINDVISSMLPSQNSPAPKDEATPAPQNEATQPPAQQEQREKSYETAAREFVEAIMKKDWDSALASMKLGEGSFVTPEDISWYFPRSSFKALAELDENSTCKVSSSSGGSDYQSVQISVAEQGGYSETVKVSMKMNKDNEWCVDASEFVNTNYTFRTPGGKTKVEVNGKELGKELITNKQAGNTGLGYDYTLSFVGKRDIDVRVYSDNFDFTKTLTPKSRNEVDVTTDYVKVVIEDTQSLFEGVKHIWNEAKVIHDTNGATVSDLLVLIASDAESDLAQSLWEKYDKQGSNTLLKMTQCLVDEENVCFWLTDSVVGANFKYQIEYDIGTSIWDKKRYGSVLVSFEDGEWKLYQMYDQYVWDCHGGRGSW